MVNDPQFMSATEKHDYIFENQRDYYVANRFGWFESLLSDIRTLIYLNIFQEQLLYL
jgi:hypothetical protein